jgi:hypothetical protein
MSLQSLNDKERQVIFECLRAVVDGPFFPDWEFHTLFGLQRSEVARIVAAIPDIDDSDERVSRAINNSLGNLLHYPHGLTEAWKQFISVPQSEVSRVFDRWRHESHAA